MKLYSTGMICLIITVAALLANVQRSQAFNHTNPFLFWGAQTLFIILFVFAILQTMLRWEPVGELTKRRFYSSIIIWGFIYAMGYTDFKQSLFFF